MSGVSQGHNDHVMRALSRCWFARLSVDGLALELDSKLMAHYDQQAGAKRKRAFSMSGWSAARGIARVIRTR